MTIAQAFNEITVAQGGTPSNSGTVAGAIDALNDALAGSDQPAEQTIEAAVRLLGQHIGGGGSQESYSISQPAVENGTYVCQLFDWDNEEPYGDPIDSARPGSTVAIVSHASDGYVVERLTVDIGGLDGGKSLITTTFLGAHVFVMPEYAVTVAIEFIEGGDDDDDILA